MPVSAIDMVVQGILASSRPAAVSSGITLVHSDSGFADPGTTVPLTLGSYQADDFALVMGSGDSGVSGFSITGGTSYNEEFDDAETSSGRTRRGAAFWKKLTASETAPTLTSADDDQFAGSILVFRGVDTTTPFDVTYAAGTHAVHGQNNYTFDVPAITTANANSCLVAFGLQTHDDLTAWGTPSGFTLAESIVANAEGSNHFNHAVAYQLDAGAAGVKAATAWGNTGTLSISDWSSRIFALRAA